MVKKITTRAYDCQLYDELYNLINGKFYGYENNFIIKK